MGGGCSVGGDVVLCGMCGGDVCIVVWDVWGGCSVGGGGGEDVMGGGCSVVWDVWGGM